MTGTCICGDVTVAIDHAPAFVNDCDCSLCRRTGAAWGYFTSASVITQGETTAFVRQDTPDAAVELHACPRCAVTTHFVLTESYRAAHPEADQVGVNMKLFDPAELAGVERRFPDGRNWDGESAYGFRRESVTMTEEAAW